jgi:crossover junction endodeoxyribonuclease RuvC
MTPVAAFVERVSAMPKQGVTSTFKFGQANGVLIGILAALHIPVHFHHAEHLEEAFSRSGAKDRATAFYSVGRVPRVELLVVREQGLAERLADADCAATPVSLHPSERPAKVGGVRVRRPLGLSPAVSP